MGEAAPVTLHRLLQPTGVSAPVTQLLHPTPTPHPHAGGRGEDEAHRGRVRTPGITGVGREDGEKAASTSLNTPRLPQAPSPQLRAGYAFGNAAPVPAGNGPFDYYPPKLCCSNQPCFKLKSWEAGNDGRRYYRCFYAGTDRDCCCKEWIDPYSPFLSTSLSEFRDKVQALERDVADEKTKSNKMQASYEMRLRAQQRRYRRPISSWLQCCKSCRRPRSSWMQQGRV